MPPRNSLFYGGYPQRLQKKGKAEKSIEILERVGTKNKARNSVIKTLTLGPFAAGYRRAMTLRNAAYDRWLLPTYSSPLPVICVGNVTAGGSGKTPFTDYLAEKLAENGRRPCILSRGYGGRYSGPYAVKLTDKARNVGDEALVHAHHCAAFDGQVVIAKERSLGASYIAASNLGDVIILDDGYQHRKLERDFNILLLDVSTDESVARWLKGKSLPLGRLREPLSDALERADCVVFVNRLPHENREVTQLEPYLRVGKSVPIFQFNLRPSHVIDVANGQRFSLSSIANRSASALTAIANPSHFFTLLDSLGVKRRSSIEYKDHHQFSRKEWEEALRAGKGLVLTTEKDAVKLRNFVSKTNQLLSVCLAGNFSSEEQEKQFYSLISATLKDDERFYENNIES